MKISFICLVIFASVCFLGAYADYCLCECCNGDGCTPFLVGSVPNITDCNASCNTAACTNAFPGHCPNIGPNSNTFGTVGSSCSPTLPPIAPLAPFSASSHMVASAVAVVSVLVLAVLI